MSVYFNSEQKQDVLTITVFGYFDNRLSQAIAELYPLKETPKKVVVNLENTDYIDSTGLGLLIGLKKHFKCDKINFRLINCNTTIATFFEVVRFDKLFTIERGSGLIESD
ncbi:MAG: anti-anti-sigma factor [Alteromonadaceae bacterium]|jgi:anti-anti-sigma factor